jgi:putative hemolysin
MNPWLIVLFSIFFSAFFSGLEIAFISSNKLKIELDRKKGLLSGRILAHFINSPSNFIAALLLGNNIALVIYGTFMANLLQEPIENNLGRFSSEFLVFIIQTIIATLIILVTAEFLPKALFRINPNKILRFFILPITVIYYLLYPVVYIFIFLSEFILIRILNIHFSQEKYQFTPIDLDNYLKELTKDKEDKDEIEPEIQMLQNAIDFQNIKIRECLVPRTEIIALEKNEPIQRLHEKFIETKHSKILIYEETIDTVVGYVHSYDLFKKPDSIKSVLKPILIVPETMLASSLMKVLIQQHKSVAVVVDEFGGTSGMLTLEDIIEEIFGEIDDEFDVEDLVEKKINDHEYHFSARHEIDYLNQNYNFELPEGEDYETLAGYIIKHHESIPEINDEIRIGEFKFTVLEASDTRIEKVSLKILND